MRYGTDFPCVHEYQQRYLNNNIPQPEIIPQFDLKQNTIVQIEEKNPINDEIEQPSESIGKNYNSEFPKLYGKTETNNFFKVCYLISSHRKMNFEESVVFCSHILLSDLQMSILDLDEPEYYALFFVRCWIENDLYKSYKFIFNKDHLK